MVIEYTGEVVRAKIADSRERLTYNSVLVHKDSRWRVLADVKKWFFSSKKNKANCYSRIINVNGDEHVFIFSKRDIEQWEELTLNYRFLSTDEQLACHCGVPRCRGVVNDIKAVEQVVELCVRRIDLTAEQDKNCK
ncbi:histone-lysine N-methyltransferase ATX2-like isoform X1 [Apium graveolens]|uniref:histone-lysine N-methyltransferase ATX2-like isoform X1 n=1 Tax=Apium graveolens TaxID=4045 RepID=UPI003D78BDA9